MPTMAMGLLGFILFFIYDLNDAYWNHKILNGLFPVGLILLGGSVIVEIVLAIVTIPKLGFISLLGLTFALLFFVGLMYTLFFALPFKSTYIDVAEGRKTFKFGVYALCRHPGLGCFIGLFFFLYLAFPSTKIAIMSIVYCALNLLYVVFQDLLTFPVIFSDYDLYKSETPFIVPNFKSIRTCCRTLNMEEGNLP